MSEELTQEELLEEMELSDMTRKAITQLKEIIIQHFERQDEKDKQR